MSETALTLIKSAFRTIGVLAVGETLSANDSAIGLENMQFMFRHWSAKNIRLYYTKQETLALTGATSYTIGSGGDLDTVRPSSIRGAFIKSSAGIDSHIKIIDEEYYRRISLKSLGGAPEYLWFSPEYPLAKLFLWPVGTGTLYLDSLKPLTDPTAITSSITLPPEYDEAVKYGLAIRLAAEYGRTSAPEVVALANSSMNDLEIKNFAEQINSVRPEIIRMTNRYNIDAG
uniref:Putative structural protein n=1 Tax=viral metagenome TaxID=1070528 RepID=A0A6M3LH03_9ZZZZ